MISIIICIILRWIAFVSALSAVTVFAQSSEIVDTAYVANALKSGAIVWDVRDAAAYQAGHIAGAVNVGPITSVLRDPIKEDWLPTAQVEKVLGSAGIDLPNKEVIVYGRAGDPTAYFGLLTVRYLGGRSGKVYQGGIDGWKAAGMTITTEPTRLAPVLVKLAPQKDVVVWTDEMVRMVAEAKAGKVQIVDVRTRQEYSGASISAIRGGHIPGALNIPVSENLANPPTPEMMAKRECNLPDGFKLKSTADLETLYANLDPDKETIVHCQSGVRAAVTATVLRTLGFKDVRLYKPGWLGYAGTLSAPADDEVFVNIGAMNRQIGSLQARIDELEKELAALKKTK
jgi:thiosulfate/3-mercaptopyruvate sulfurtransferase